MIPTIHTHRWRCPVCDAWGLIDGDGAYLMGLASEAHAQSRPECAGNLDVQPVICGNRYSCLDCGALLSWEELGQHQRAAGHVLWATAERFRRAVAYDP